MIAVVPIVANKKDSLISLKFSRSKFFALLYKEEKQFEIIENPFTNDQTQVGKNIFNLLTKEKRASIFIAYELGLKVQQMATNRSIQLVILNKKDNTLQEILNYMNIK